MRVNTVSTIDSLISTGDEFEAELEKNSYLLEVVHEKGSQFLSGVYQIKGPPNVKRAIPIPTEFYNRLIWMKCDLEKIKNINGGKIGYWKIFTDDDQKVKAIALFLLEEKEKEVRR